MGTTLDSFSIKKIKVFLYSYKNKDLLDFCINLKKNSTNDIFIDIYDQNTVDRSEIFSKDPNIKYTHIQWDDRKGVYYYRIMSLFGNFDYFLSISDSTIFKFGWDNKLIKECGDRDVVSGKNIISLNIDKFFIKENYKISQAITESQWINKDFIFLKMSNAVFLSKSKFLKKYGDQLVLSILFNEHGFKIKSMHDLFYDKIYKEKKYLPYSKYHGYNKLMLMIKNKEIKSEKFEKYHGIDLSNLKLLPFETDDVPYYKAAYSIDFEDETRFHNVLKKIEIV